MSTTFMLLISLYAPTNMPVTLNYPGKPLVTKPITTSGELDSKSKNRIPKVIDPGIAISVKPENNKNMPVTKMIGVETESYVYMPGIVKIPFLSKAGCEAACKDVATLAKSVCLEIR